MKITIEAVGFKAFKGVIDGKSIDSGAVYSRVRLDVRNNVQNSETTNFKSGENTEEFKLPNSTVAMQHLRDVTFPCVIQLDVERVSNGRETKEFVTDLAVMNQPAVRSVSHAKVA